MTNSTAWDSAAASVQYAVHLGTWTNWSRGPIMGATLTISRTNGNYLLAFTAFFISLVSVRFWRILCFLLHGRLSTSVARDALHHQRQVILRNSDSATASLWSLLQLVWAWRGTAQHLLLRTLPIIATATFCAAAFTVAGGFSSQISTGIGNEVLLNGSNCGIAYSMSLDQGSGPHNTVLYVANQVLNADNYAQQCYAANAVHPFDCTTFILPRLSSSVDYNASCPFDESICRSNASNIRLDTGYIDTSKHLGVNAPANERILFRTILECAPLQTEGYSETIALSSGNYTRYYYGPKTEGSQNFTYEVPSLASQYPLVQPDGESDDPFHRRGQDFALA